MIGRFTCLALAGLASGGVGASAQEPSVEAELDAFWAEVVRSVEDWSVDAQRATYHPDAISVGGDAASYGTRLITEAFDEIEGTSTPPSNPGVGVSFLFARSRHGHCP